MTNLVGILVAFGCVGKFEGFDGGDHLFGWGIGLNDSDISEDGFEVGEGNVRFHVVVSEGFRFNRDGDTSKASMSGKRLNNEVVAFGCRFSTKGGAAHGVGMISGGSRRLTKRAKTEC